MAGLAVLNASATFGMRRPTLLLLAGEASGDLYGAQVARALRRRFPDARMIGMGGPLMAAAGVELRAELDDLAVMGFTEIISRLGLFRKLHREVSSLLRSRNVDLVLPIDYPGFNLRVARAAHVQGIPVLFYVSPQVWAWRAGRARKLAAWAEHVAVILPFEESLLRKAGANVTFVGHPLLDRPHDVADREGWCQAAGLDPARPILGMLPGSRVQEIARHLHVFAATARKVARERPDVQPALARARSLGPGQLTGTGFPVVDDARALLRHSQAALVKSGTGTLEAALEGTPFVVAYRTSHLTYQIARRLVRVDHVALANLVAGERVVPERIQGRATPEELAPLLLPLLDGSSEERRRMVEGLGRVRHALGCPGASERVAELAAGILERAGE